MVRLSWRSFAHFRKGLEVVGVNRMWLNSWERATELVVEEVDKIKALA
jgi:hypothetical protein